MKLSKNNIIELLILGTLGLMYADFAPDWISEWMNFDSFYAFGFFMLAFIVYLTRKNFQNYLEVEKNNCGYGLLFLLAGFLFYFTGIKGDYTYFTTLSLPVFLCGIVLYLWGWKLFKMLFFPLALFAFALPIIPLHRITMPLQLFSANATTAILDFLGMHVQNEGNNIMLEGHKISVVAGCSGLKSSYSILFISIIYSYFINSKFIKKVAFVLSSIVLALVLNVLRILTVSFFVLYNGGVNAEEFHDSVGIVAYILSIIIIVLMAGFIEENKPEIKEESEKI